LHVRDLDVGGAYSLFTAAWEAATDLDAYLRGEVPELAPEAREILRALGAGLTDEVAARRLGTSLRTYRRRVAELMAVLEAGSRFQAGVRARVLYAVQGRVSESLFREKTTAAAWRSKPSWYAISRRDRTTSPELQRFLAKRMNAATVEIDSGHLSLITHPDEVTQLILSATRTASQYAAAGGS